MTYTGNLKEEIIDLVNNLAKLSSASNSITYTNTSPINIEDMPMWLVTDKNGSSKILICANKPIRGREEWYSENRGEYEQAYLYSPLSSKIFGMFWRKASQELERMGLPKWEDDPIEVELSRIKFNYY